MSRTSAIGFRGRWLWAHREGLQVLLALMVEAAAGRATSDDEPWFAAIVQQWQVQASVADLGCTLDDSWSPEQLALVRDLIEGVRGELRAPDAAGRVLRPGWSVLDDLPVAGGVGTERVIERVDEVADALLQLLDGRLPPNPPGAWWFVGTAEPEWRHIEMRSEPGRA